MITRFGDMLSESMLNKIKRFNKTQQTILCFDGIKSEYLEADDLQTYFQPRVINIYNNLIFYSYKTIY